MNSAEVLFDLVDALRELMSQTPVNPDTSACLVRVLDGLADYTAFLTLETEFRQHRRLRLVTNDSPKRSRRRRPDLRLGQGG